MTFYFHLFQNTSIFLWHFIFIYFKILGYFYDILFSSISKYFNIFMTFYFHLFQNTWIFLWHFISIYFWLCTWLWNPFGYGICALGTKKKGYMPCHYHLFHPWYSQQIIRNNSWDWNVGTYLFALSRNIWMSQSGAAHEK